MNKAKDPLKNSIVGTKFSHFERKRRRPTKAYQKKIRLGGLSRLQPKGENRSHEGDFQRVPNNKIRIVVQNKGRLMKPSLAYLKKCGLKFAENGRNLIVPCKNSDVEILFVRNSDIPEYVRYSVADFGIVGRNVLMEKENNLKTVQELDFGKCSLVIAVPEKSKITNLADLDHERIATSYPRILKDFLKKQGVSSSIIEIRGSVEICPSLGLADAIFDITQTGKTLKENGLKVIEKVADSQAVLIQNPNSNLSYENLFV